MFASSSSYNSMASWTSVPSEPPSLTTYTPATAKYGRTGLGNIGNTCYMNTAIQCLSHTPRLVQLLITDEYKKLINKDNQSSTKGQAINAFAELVKRLWLGSDSSVTPRDFKSVIERFATQFAGYQQHDSQEFLIMLLDLLHEDINKVSSKPYIELPTYTSFSPTQSAEMWNYHLQRNDSRVIDMFYGQTVTFIKCSKCGAERVKYEPFSVLTLPLPPEKATLLVNILSGSFSGYEGTPTASEVTLTLKKSALTSEILPQLAASLSLPEKQIAVYVEQNGRYDPLSVFPTVSRLVDGYYSNKTLVAFILPREQEASDYCLLVQPAVLSMASINYYLEPRVDATNAGVPFCLLCEGEESCLSIGKRVEACVIKHYGLDSAAIGKEIREWQAVCTDVIKAKKERKSEAWPKYSPIVATGNEKRVCGTVDGSGNGVEGVSPVSGGCGACKVGDTCKVGGAHHANSIPISVSVSDDVKGMQEDGVDAQQKADTASTDACPQNMRDYMQQQERSFTRFTSTAMDEQASQNTSSITKSSHAYRKLSSSDDSSIAANHKTLSSSDDSPITANHKTLSSTHQDSDSSHSLSSSHDGGLLGGAACMPGNDFSDSSSSSVDIHPELSYNQATTEPCDVDDWDRCAPYVPLLHSNPSYCVDFASQLVMCNTNTPFKRHVVTPQLIVVVGAAMTSTLRDATTLPTPTPTYSSYSYSSYSSYSYSYDNVFSDPSTFIACRSLPSFTRISKETQSIQLKLANAKTETNDRESTLHHCFELFSQRGNLDEENKWYCSHCQEHVCAENATHIDRLPDTLMIQLERFEYTASPMSYGSYGSYGGYGGYGSYGGRRKISSLISFPLHDLDMREWLHPQSCEQTEDCVYDLRAICNHSGSSSGGHYYCFACDENAGKEEWMEYNDSSVYPIAEESLVRDTAYVLFYQRRTHRLRTDSLIHCVEVQSAKLREGMTSLGREQLEDSTPPMEELTTEKTKSMEVMEIETTEAKEREDLY